MQAERRDSETDTRCPRTPPLGKAAQLHIVQPVCPTSQGNQAADVLGDVNVSNPSLSQYRRRVFFQSVAGGSGTVGGRERLSKDSRMRWLPARWQPRVLSRWICVVSQGSSRPACRPKRLDLGSKSLSAPKIGYSFTRTEADILELNHSPHKPMCCPSRSQPRQVAGSGLFQHSNGTNSGSEEKDEGGDQSSSSSNGGRRALLINRDGRYGPLKPAALSRPKWLRPCSDVASGAGSPCLALIAWSE